MRYLTLSADYRQVSIRDDFGDAVDLVSLDLSDSFQKKIQAWNDRYQAIVPLELATRAQPEILERIEALDREGMELIQAMKEYLRDVKIRYYSEGLLRYLE